jgi:hypothetical protein
MPLHYAPHAYRAHHHPQRLSLSLSGTLYNVDKRESLRSNPYAYLLSLEKELA